jgi:hypothetical protein
MIAQLLVMSRLLQVFEPLVQQVFYQTYMQIQDRQIF